ncbi:phage head-tail family protein, putative (macronuclear) [Tetrahymena thermophila SB210]|uniref:Phage head-tail family protein, putative n=1 Tax=Tetrahymena thermophila (strain SB210) TaxID=312017 RepID=Q241C6_TETTS|nr:phage head-tail family protein, putative [Tetrahymena thermophila SB210]EAS02382.2 phage head-tail family protein, putative [Tetrahymena thermophila SB210]|eukprot:XP_001022627.2 phage head-tail family protein, putative [Tetrahymena thermophila SB210]
METNQQNVKQNSQFSLSSSSSSDENKKQGEKMSQEQCQQGEEQQNNNINFNDQSKQFQNDIFQNNDKISNNHQFQQSHQTNENQQLSGNDQQPYIFNNKPYTQQYRDLFNNYDAYKIPPDFVKADQHRLANTVGPEKDINQIKENENIEYCECCARQIQRNQLSLKCNIYELSFLGCGFPLYFYFLKQCMIMLSICLFVCGIFNIITNIIGSEPCTKQQESQQNNASSSNEAICVQGGYFSIFALGRKQDQDTFMQIQGYLNLTSMIAMMIFLQFFRKLQRELAYKCDDEDIAANDYTIMIKNIPKDFDAINDDYDDDIKEFFEKNSLQEKRVEVISVTLCYNLTEITALQNQKEKLIQQKKKCLTTIYKTQNQIDSYDYSKDKLSRQITEKEAQSQNEAIQKQNSIKLKVGIELGQTESQNDQIKRETFDENLDVNKQLEIQEKNKSNQNMFQSLNGSPLQSNVRKDYLQFLTKHYSNSIDQSNVDIPAASDMPQDIAEKSEKNLKIKFKGSKSIEMQIKRLKEQLLEEEKNLKIIEKQISYLDKQHQDLTQKLMQGQGKEFMKKYFTGKALVCFKYEQDKEEIINRYKAIGISQKIISREKNLAENQMIYHGNKLTIIQAPDPNDINWMNLHVSNKEKIKRRLIGFFLSIVTLCICASAIYAFHVFQQSQVQGNKESSNTVKIQIITYALAILINVYNFILCVILQIINRYCKNSTRTKDNIFLSKSLSTARFINSAIVGFIIQLYVSKKSTKQEILFGQGGLADDANYFMITNCILPTIAQVVNVEYYIQAFLRKIEEKKGNQSVKTQEELNLISENPQFPIEERYAQLLTTMFTTAFYCPIVPITIIWSLICFILQYWIDKYNLIYRSSVKYNMSSELSLEMTEHLEYFLPIQCLSTLIFYQYANGGEFGLSSILGTVLGFLHAFLPMQEINERFFNVKNPQANTIDYESAQKYFITDYNRENPIYKMQARQNHVLNMSMKVSVQKDSLRRCGFNLGHQLLEDSIQSKNSQTPQQRQSIFSPQFVITQENENRFSHFLKHNEESEKFSSNFDGKQQNPFQKLEEKIYHKSSSYKKCQIQQNIKSDKNDTNFGIADHDQSSVSLNFKTQQQNNKAFIFPSKSYTINKQNIQFTLKIKPFMLKLPQKSNETESSEQQPQKKQNKINNLPQSRHINSKSMCLPTDLRIISKHSKNSLSFGSKYDTFAQTFTKPNQQQLNTAGNFEKLGQNMHLQFNFNYKDFPLKYKEDHILDQQIEDAIKITE